MCLPNIDSDSRIHYVILNIIDSVQLLEAKVTGHNQFNRIVIGVVLYIERESGMNVGMNLWILVVVYSLSEIPSVWTRDCSDIACIRNSEDLKANYKCDQLSVAGGHNMFLRYNLGSVRNDIQAVYYNITIRDTNYTSKLESTFTNKCCNPSDKYCIVFFVYSSAIFYNIHPGMLYFLTFFHWTKKSITSITLSFVGVLPFFVKKIMLRISYLTSPVRYVI